MIYPNIRSVFKNENTSICFGVIKIIVSRFVDSFGFSTKLTESQIDLISVDTFENFAYDSIQDIIIFFKMARSGKFGTTKKGVDSNLIFGEWFPMYMELKAEAREKQHEKEKKELCQNSLSVEEVKKQWEKKTKKSFHERVLDYIEEITNGINREQLELIISEWENDPDKRPYSRDLKRKRLVIKN